MKKKILLPVTFSLYLILIAALTSCHKPDDGQEDTGGRLVITFQHSVDGSPLITDSLMYQNAAGNPYLVSEIQYFISDVVLHLEGGDSISVNKYDDIHYVDTDIDESFVYYLPDTIPEGKYESVSFTFGINEEKNRSLMFVNPPESNMFWPENLGGGYHYMKLNGKWQDTAGIIRPFNFHLGIGQIYDSTGQITGFVQNYFFVDLPSSSLEIVKSRITQMDIDMNVNEWFENPVVFDFNVWGGKIMQNQEAMHIGCENGHNVFSVKDIKVLLPEK